MSKIAGIAAALTLAAAALLAPATARAQGPVAVQRAMNAVSGEGQTIMAWVYPTAAFRSIAPCTYREGGPGYLLDCTFRYTDSDGDAGHRRLVFQVDQAGIIEGIRDAGGSSFWPAFSALRLGKEILASMARDELRRGAASDQLQQALLDLLARGPEPEEVLAFLLDVRIVSRS